jgi:Fe-S oxidoreductase
VSENQPDVYVTKNPRIYKYHYDMRGVAEDCVRCSNCKWVDPWEMKSQRYARICPINTHFLVDAYSSQGRMDIALAILDGRLDYDDSPMLLDIIYVCDTCGGCDAMCKRNGDREVLRVSLDLRAQLVEAGQILPQHMPLLDSLRKEDNTMMGLRADRGKWADGLTVKDLTRETAEVVFHAGCHLSFNEDLWPTGRATVKLLQDMGLDVGVFGKDELCCGCKLYDMGYRGEYTKYAESNIDAWKTAKAKMVVTTCSDGYWAMKKLYPQNGLELPVYHIVEFIDQRIRENKLKFSRSVPMKVTYHDPCHLGRRMDDFEPGKEIWGVFDAPRDILKSIPGLELREMERIKENAWCCGAGGGVREAFPEHSAWTAAERVSEAIDTGADAIVTACPWCETNFRDVIEERGDKIKVYDIVDLVSMAL